MSRDADFAAIVPWAGVRNKPDYFPTTPALIAQGGAANGEILVWNQARGRWEPGNTFPPGSVSWGDISGTLSDQTDLQLALNAKASIVSLATVAFTGNYSDLIGAPTSLPPSGPAGGFLSGTYPNPTGPSSLPPSGAAGGMLAGTYPNPTENTGYSPTFANVIASSSVLTSIMQAQRYNLPLITQTGSGAIAINIGNQNRTLINATGAFTLSLNSISPDIPNWIFVHNTTGAPIVPTWPAWVVANGATLPTSIAAGAWISLGIQPTGTVIGSVVVGYAAASAVTPPISTYLPTTGDLHSRLRKAIPGTITGGGDMVWTKNTWFSWADYNGVPNSTNPTDATNNVAVMAALIADAFAYATAIGAGGATVYVPDGEWYIDDQLTFTWPANCSLTIKGNGRHSSIIVQAGSGKRGIYCELSAGTNKRNRVTICDLGLKTASGVIAADAIMVDYGPAGIVSSEAIGGSIVERIEIGNWAEVDSGGWTWGVTMKNAWHWLITDVYGFGGTGWNTPTTPGAGNGSAGGSGAFIRAMSGVNYSMGSIFGNAWSQFIRIEDAGLATPVDAQGVLTQHANCITCQEFVHAYAGPGGAGLLMFTLVNFQCDNGNFYDPTFSGLIFEGNAGNITISDGAIYQNGGVNILLLDEMAGCIFTGISFKCVGNNPSGNHIQLLSANVNMFNGCNFITDTGSFVIEFDAGSGLNQINNYGPATITDLGGANRKLQYLF